MWRRLWILVVALISTSCSAPDYRAMQASLAETARARLARMLLAEYSDSIDLVLAGLTAKGGFLDNPLVKVLLPPPVGLMLAVGQALYGNPRATMMEIVVNRAAESAVPGAGPILKGAVEKLIIEGEAERFLSGDATGLTDYLKNETREELQRTLLPEVSAMLDDTGATDSYAQLVRYSELVAAVDAEVGGDTPVPPVNVTEVVTPDELGNYVTERAVEGIFKRLEQRERELRARINSGTVGRMANP